jgi:hypothetical protein
MTRRNGVTASLLAVFIVMAPAARADDPIKDIIDHEVPALKDGTRIALPDVQSAILAACERRKFEASVVSPGLITARGARRAFVRREHSVYGQCLFDPLQGQPADGLQPGERALKRLKLAQKQARAAAR